MDFNLSHEQAMLTQAVSRLFEREHDPGTRRRRLAGEPVPLDRLWPQLADMGVLGINLPSPHGVMDLDAQEAAIASHLVAQAMGKTLATDPFISCCVVASPLLASLGTTAQKDVLLHAVAAGSTRITLAHAEGGPGSDLITIHTQARTIDGGYCLNGHKLGVLDAQGATHFIVAARTDGAPDDEEGVSLFLVASNQPGLSVRSSLGFDGGDVGELQLDNVKLDAAALLGPQDKALAALHHAVHRGMAALVSEASGAMERLLELSIEHLKTRQQFGQPLAQFQALQHHIAGMATALEQARSMALYAAAACADQNAAMRGKALSAAKVLVGQESLAMARRAVQLHGGMGMTDEVLVGHLFRRLMTINATWGSAEEHLQRYSETLSP